eukprot:7597974-Pyramimonas_sp.AAC.1
MFELCLGAIWGRRRLHGHCAGPASVRAGRHLRIHPKQRALLRKTADQGGHTVAKPTSLGSGERLLAKARATAESCVALIARLHAAHSTWSLTDYLGSILA